MGSLREAPAVWFSALVGGMDALTGALLMWMPATTIALFGAEMPAGDDVTMRWVGAFVFGVGASYLWAVAPRETATRVGRLRGVWGGTALVRVVIALFVGVMVFRGRLDPAWLVVALTDASVAIVQMWWLRREDGGA